MKNLKNTLRYSLYLLLVCVFTSCYVHNYEYEKACEICKEYDGVEYVNIDLWEKRVRCNDEYYQALNAR